MLQRGHQITEVIKGSIAEEMGVEPGDRLIRINGHTIVDIFDYQYYIEDEEIVVLIQKEDGEEWELEIEKEESEDFGVSFESSLMDEYRSCKNNCIFCFIDQMPKGMRETLYFKDDDTRLSFLQGNYVTLTNLSDEDIERIIRYHMSPINISFHTTNPTLRCKMLHNRFAGEALKKVDQLIGGFPSIELNGQIVLCKGINDGKELTRTITDLTSYLPNLKSVSVVPVGLSKYRDGLYPLSPFTKEDAVSVLKEIHSWQDRLYAEYGTHFIHASDEFYLLAGFPIPDADNYDGYCQLENGVGMVRLLLDEFREAFARMKAECDRSDACDTISVVTGKLVYPFINELMGEVMAYAPGMDIRVHEIINDFFGENITVTGLLTGGDIIRQLREKPLGTRILLPSNVLRAGEDYLLDDVRVSDIEEALHTKVDIIPSSGEGMLQAIFS